MSSGRTGPAYACALLAELRQDEADVRSVASQLNLEIREVDADGFDGALVRVRESPLGAIVVRESIREATRKTFTIAHEIGHFLIPGHAEGDLVCTPTDVGNWGDLAKNREREADEFAAELLMPTSVVEALLRDRSPSLRVIEHIAARCRTSLSAAAWRYCDLTTAPCAVVWSSAGRIEWSKRSGAFGFSLRKGASIQPGTFAHGCSSAAQAPKDPRPVAASLWITGQGITKEAEVWEESRALPNYQSVLSLLWIRSRS